MDDYEPEIQLKQPKNLSYAQVNPLWFVDFICAKLRARVAVFSRRTWTTAKGIADIQTSLYLFLAYHNRLPLFKKSPKAEDFIGPMPPKVGRQRLLSYRKRKLIEMIQDGELEELDTCD